MDLLLFELQRLRLINSGRLTISQQILAREVVEILLNIGSKALRKVFPRNRRGWLSVIGKRELLVGPTRYAYCSFIPEPAGPPMRLPGIGSEGLVLEVADMGLHIAIADRLWQDSLVAAKMYETAEPAAQPLVRQSLVECLPLGG